MIILSGIPSEPPLRLAIGAAERRGYEYVVFNQREAHLADLRLDFRDGRVSGTLGLRGRRVEAGRVRGVYVRLMDAEDLPEHRRRNQLDRDSVDVHRSRAAHAALLEWLNIAPCRVVNRPGHALSNMSKAYQALAIRRCGFSVPATLITNEFREVIKFVRARKRVVYKSASGIRSIVEELTRERMRQLDRVRNLPTQFQEYIPGTNVRVHTIGRKCFAAEIVSDAIDYRYAARFGSSISIRACALPAKVANRCVELAQTLGLPFAGIDLKRTRQGRHYCFEVNPSPAYSYYEEETGQPIAEALVDYLARGD